MPRIAGVNHRDAGLTVEGFRSLL